MLSSSSGKVNTDPKKMDLADADSIGKSQVISPAGSEAGYDQGSIDRFLQGSTLAREKWNIGSNTLDEAWQLLSYIRTRFRIEYHHKRKIEVPDQVIPLYSGNRSRIFTLLSCHFTTGRSCQGKGSTLSQRLCRHLRLNYDTKIIWSIDSRANPSNSEWWPTYLKKRAFNIWVKEYRKVNLEQT